VPPNNAALVSSGILKSFPSPPSEFSSWPYDITPAFDTAGTTAADILAWWRPSGVSDELCKTFNDRYTSLGANVPTYDLGAGGLPAVAEPAVFCYFDDDDGRNEILALLFVN